MFENNAVYVTLPVQDMDRARSFYEEKLGLTPTEEEPGQLTYRLSRGAFTLFESSGAPSGDHTQMGWDVEDLEATVAELRGRGIEFKEYDPPGFKTENGIARVGNELGAWFADSEGNVIGLGQQVV